MGKRFPGIAAVAAMLCGGGAMAAGVPGDVAGYRASEARKDWQAAGD